MLKKKKNTSHHSVIQLEDKEILHELRRRKVIDELINCDGTISLCEAFITPSLHNISIFYDRLVIIMSYLRKLTSICIIILCI